MREKKLAAGTGSSSPFLGKSIDFRRLRARLRITEILAAMGWASRIVWRGDQGRGPCPIHDRDGGSRKRPFSVHRGRGVYKCFDRICLSQGNALDLYAAWRRLSVYDAAVELCDRYRIPRNGEEEPVQGTFRFPIQED